MYFQPPKKLAFDYTQTRELESQLIDLHMQSA